CPPGLAGPRLGREAVEHARERDGLANVWQPAHPRHGALDAESETGMREGAVTPDVEVPLERRPREAMLVDRGLELHEVVLALSAADDLAVPLGREHVHVERQARVSLVALEVERLQADGVAVHDDRAVELAADDGLLVAPEVVAHLRLGVTVLPQ